MERRFAERRRKDNNNDNDDDNDINNNRLNGSCKERNRIVSTLRTEPRGYLAW